MYQPPPRIEKETATMSTAKILAEALEDVTVDALVTKQHAAQLVEELAAALDVRGYAIKKKPAAKKPAEPVEAFAPATGNAELDDFMRRNHRTDWRANLKKALVRTRPGMVSMPAPTPGWKTSNVTQDERAELWRNYGV